MTKPNYIGIGIIALIFLVIMILFTITQGARDAETHEMLQEMLSDHCKNNCKIEKSERLHTKLCFKISDKWRLEQLEGKKDEK